MTSSNEPIDVTSLPLSCVVSAESHPSFQTLDPMPFHHSDQSPQTTATTKVNPFSSLKPSHCPQLLLHHGLTFLHILECYSIYLALYQVLPPIILHLILIILSPSCLLCHLKQLHPKKTPKSFELSPSSTSQH